ncbi:MAG: hypothetical protein JWR58_1233 [Pseudonocardia sp.]|jgi:hypothetical protein|nr:hypothetical protein [Pseudonocardia sp.]
MAGTRRTATDLLTGVVIGLGLVTVVQTALAAT